MPAPKALGRSANQGTRSYVVSSLSPFRLGQPISIEPGGRAHAIRPSPELRGRFQIHDQRRCSRRRRISIRTDPSSTFSKPANQDQRTVAKLSKTVQTGVDIFPPFLRLSQLRRLLAQ